MGFRFSVAFEAFAHGFAQMIERGFQERRQAPPLLAFPARRTPPAIHALADCG